VTESPLTPDLPLFPPVPAADPDAVLIALGTDLQLPWPFRYRLASSLSLWLGSGERPSVLARRTGVPARILSRALERVPQAAELARCERERAAALGARLLSRADPDYPPGLLDLPASPPVLFVRGTLPAAPRATVVGSRRADLYGLEVARSFARGLAEAGVAVVSGFARGIDTAAHRGALEAPNGRTVAVLGCGLDIDYPRGSSRLASEIAERGAVVSEFPLGTPPAQWQFPVRNRILAALSRMTVVVRATARSGSLSTARLALDLGREVLAVPGRIFEPGSVGPNELLRDGAAPALSADQLLEILGVPRVPEESATGAVGLDDPVARVLAALPPAEPLGVEEIALAAGLELATTQALLFELELAGQLERQPGGTYFRPL
jgi:DNA processing protein